MLIKERININAIESRTSHADTHLSDTLNGSTQESSHVVNERLMIWNTKKARQHKVCLWRNMYKFRLSLQLIA